MPKDLPTFVALFCLQCVFAMENFSLSARPISFLRSEFEFSANALLERLLFTATTPERVPIKKWLLEIGNIKYQVPPLILHMDPQNLSELEHSWLADICTKKSRWNCPLGWSRFTYSVEFQIVLDAFLKKENMTKVGYLIRKLLLPKMAIFSIPPGNVSLEVALLAWACLDLHDCSNDESHDHHFHRWAKILTNETESERNITGLKNLVDKKVKDQLLEQGDEHWMRRAYFLRKIRRRELEKEWNLERTVRGASLVSSAVELKLQSLPAVTVKNILCMSNYFNTNVDKQVHLLKLALCLDQARETGKSIL